MDFLEELGWRGLLQDVTPDLAGALQKEKLTAYAGFDPSADSLHIGNLVPVTLLYHLQQYGHKPVVLMGGATGQIGDPSGKSQERQLLDMDAIEHNLACQKAQLERFVDFNGVSNRAELVNNSDWVQSIGFLEFLREVGKHITVSYMMAKDSVKNRLEGGISFAEFSYQLVQGYDFYWLYKNMNVKLQVGGSDQWGNMLTGTELIRRKAGGEAHALTAPLITKADGSKFGKSEGGNVWLDARKTSPYKFYQYWLNVSDDDAERFMRVFSFRGREEIGALIDEHRKAVHLRVLQQALSGELTARIHSSRDLENALGASKILFGNATREELLRISVDQLLEVFSDVPQHTIPRNELDNLSLVDLLSDKTGILPSRSEARRMLSSNSISLNKEKVAEDRVVAVSDLIRDRFLLVQRGKKNYHLIQTVG